MAPGLGSEDVALQRTPVLWAASALGQIGIVPAFGDTVCIGSQEFEWSSKMDQDLSYGEWRDIMDEEE